MGNFIYILVIILLILVKTSHSADTIENYLNANEQNIDVPSLISPKGEMMEKIKYVWSNTNALKYRYQVVDMIANETVKTVTVNKTVCNSSVCSNSPIDVTYAINRWYKWRIRQYKNEVWSNWSNFVAFKPIPFGFNSFNGNSSGWSVVEGNWEFTEDKAVATGQEGVLSSIQYNDHIFSDFTYIANVSKNYGASDNNANILFVRGSPAQYMWEHSYLFMYTNTRHVSVAKTDSNGITMLQSWVYNPAVDWHQNQMQVTVVGQKFKFLMNGEQVWSGTDNSFLAGKVGVGTYGKGEFIVDWARLKRP